jgi:hypothetical protein
MNSETAIEPQRAQRGAGATMGARRLRAFTPLQLLHEDAAPTGSNAVIDAHAEAV